ncbi:hypothetical protein [Rhodobacter capsulatus]|uniref:hypothetical protein n=1 Tax=Rhodobacter capsulatus TaxID=1061 RepID=UPI004028D79C
MRNCLIVFLVLTNAATGYALFQGIDEYERVRTQFVEARQKIAEIESTKTTDFERENYGQECVKWLREEGTKDGKRDGEFYLGRSWKKYGQMVFEVIVPKDQIGRKTGNFLCTFDAQSGMMYSLEGPAQERWMFY